LVAATITATDVDGDALTFTLSGTDAALLSIDSDGNLTFDAAPDFETKASYELTVTVSDGSGSVSQAITISITDVNEVPQINALASALSADENQTQVVTVSATDPDASTTLSFSISGDDSALFAISASGVLTFKAAPDYEAPGDADGDNIYAINIVVSDGALSVTQAITIAVVNLPDLVSGVAVDGYVAGATVFQDLNNDGDLDVGEPSAATNAMGSFTLTLTAVAVDTPVRIINGYDLASNEIHPSILDISATEGGSYIITPISTLVGRLKVQDTSLTSTISQSMIAGALGISMADSPNDSILGFDPIAYFNGADATLAAEARPVFAASQLLMSLGGGNYSVHQYVVDQALSALSSTLTSAAGTTITLSSADDTTALKQDAYDAIFNGYVDTTLALNPPINNIQFKNNKAVMTDYLNGSSANAVNYSLYGIHDGASTLVADLVGAKLDYDNLKKILDNDATGTPMDLAFELSNIPPAGTGSTSVTLKLFYGDDTTQDSDEDYLEVVLTANWESDGTNFTIELPASSSLTAKFYGRGGTELTKVASNASKDILTVTKDGPDRPANLTIRLSELFNVFPDEVTQLSSFLDGNSEFTYQVTLGSFTLYDHLDNPFTTIQGTFSVDANPGVVVFADDIYIHENAASKDITFYLSQAAAADVTVTYTLSEASTASSADYTLSSGTISIPAGSISATLNIPITNDTLVEPEEELQLSLSNAQNAALGRTSVSAFIIDGEEILANSTQKAILADNTFKDSKASINAYIKNKLDTSTVTISGISYTFSQVLVNNSITSDVYSYLDSIIDDYKVMSETLNSTLMTKVDAYIDSQLSSFATYTGFATALTQLNSGIKGLNVSQIVGANINTDGSFPAGQNATTLQTALDGKVDTLVTLAADTVADILGTDTNTNFPNANVVMGTDGDETITGTSGSDLIASFGGTDTVNALAGNDKILGGAGVDTLNGGDDNDHLYGYAGADTLNGNAGDDLIYGGKDDDTIDGDAGDDSLYGEAGDDTITSGAGNDTLDGGLDNDAITIDGAGDKTINGGPGTDSLTINYGSISSLNDFAIDRSGDYTSFTDGDGNQILFKNIETIVIGGKSYVGVYDGVATTGDATLNTSGNYYDPGPGSWAWVPGGTLSQNNFGNNIISSTYYDNTNKEVYMYPYDDNQGSHLSVRALNQVGYDDSSALSIFGTEYNDLIAGHEFSNSAALTINSYAGLDVINISNHTGADTVDAGSGNDIVHVNNSYASDTSIDGGDGTDWLIILAGSSAVNYTINSSTTTNFENVRTSYGDDTITGDDSANRLVGWGGADTISGGNGNDELYGYVDQNPQGVSDGIDNLYGGAGDDSLYGGAGDDLLDGGTGKDTLTGDGGAESYDRGGARGADTFVIRAGDGGASIDLADVITDFEDGEDLIGMSGLEYSQLTIEQGTGDYANHVVVKKTDTGEFLVIIQNTSLSSISNADFSAI